MTREFAFDDAPQEKAFEFLAISPLCLFIGAEAIEIGINRFQVVARRYLAILGGAVAALSPTERILASGCARAAPKTVLRG